MSSRPHYQAEFLRSSKNAFIMQSKSTFLEFLRCIHRDKFGPPKKFFRGKIIEGEWRNFHRARALFLAGVEFFCLASWCASFSRVRLWLNRRIVKYELRLPILPILRFYLALSSTAENRRIGRIVESVHHFHKTFGVKS